MDTAGFARGGEALEGAGGGPVAATAAAAGGSDGVLGAATPVTSPGAEVGGGKDKDSLEWSEVGTECHKRVYICTNRREVGCVCVCGEGGQRCSSHTVKIFSAFRFPPSGPTKVSTALRKRFVHHGDVEGWKQLNPNFI